MRVIRWLVLPLLVAGLLVFGWTYDVPEPPPGPLAETELGWIAAARAWLREPLPARCSVALADAPTKRLDRVAGAFEDACEEPDPALALARSREARALLAGELRDRRPLPVSDGLVGTSRIEPRLGRALRVLARGRRVQVRCWSQSDWQRVRAEEAALAGVATLRREWFWLPSRRSLHLQGIHCGPLVLLAKGVQPQARGARADLAIALWTASAAAESVSARPCVPPARLAMLLGASRGYAFGLVRFARRELEPVLPPAGRRCLTALAS
jgi:hypothetical protein